MSFRNVGLEKNESTKDSFLTDIILSIIMAALIFANLVASGAVIFK